MIGFSSGFHQVFIRFSSGFHQVFTCSSWFFHAFFTFFIDFGLSGKPRHKTKGLPSENPTLRYTTLHPLHFAYTYSRRNSARLPLCFLSVEGYRDFKDARAFVDEARSAPFNSSVIPDIFYSVRGVGRSFFLKKEPKKLLSRSGLGCLDYKVIPFTRQQVGSRPHSPVCMATVGAMFLLVSGFLSLYRYRQAKVVHARKPSVWRAFYFLIPLIAVFRSVLFRADAMGFLHFVIMPECIVSTQSIPAGIGSRKTRRRTPALQRTTRHTANANGRKKARRALHCRHALCFALPSAKFSHLSGLPHLLPHF